MERMSAVRIAAGLAQGRQTAVAAAAAALARADAYDAVQPQVWIARGAVRRGAGAGARDRCAAGGGEALPLAGVPFAVKDNIDVAGLPTTAACPAFAYLPAESATVVQRLQAAGALLLGKTNLDQFATGLVGTRSPYGVPACVFNREYISGGSSSGSAVAVRAPAWWPSRWGRTPPARGACRRPSTGCSASSPPAAAGARAASCRPAGRWTASAPLPATPPMRHWWTIA